MKNFEIALLLSILASLTHITAFVIYNYKQIFGDSKPNIVSWLLWACLASLNFFSYIVSLLSFTSSLMCLLTFGISLFKGKFSKLDWVDYTTLFFGSFTVCIWIIFKSAMYANFIALIGASIAFIPTYKSVFSNPKNEPPLPWFLWSVAFFLLLLVVLLKFDGTWGNFVYPGSMLILHFGVCFKAIKNN